MTDTIHAIDCDLGEDCTCNPERYRIFVLCECEKCDGSGKQMWAIEGRPERYVNRRHAEGAPFSGEISGGGRCPECRGEGRVRREVATTGTPEGVGTAIVRCAREGEFEDCPIGILDSEGEKGKKWLVRPWQPSPREVADAGRVLAKSRWS